MRCSRTVTRCFSLGVTVFLLASTAITHAATPQQVDTALKKAQAFLLTRQKQGNWEASPQPDSQFPNEVRGGQWGGISALATYALLAGGADPQSAPMKAALQFLANAKLGGVYAIGVRAQVWSYLHGAPEVAALVKRDGDLLAKAMRNTMQARGMFFYTAGFDTNYDHSVSQFGVLGMWACAQVGYETSTAFWANADQGWRRHQERDGGWCYRNDSDSPDQKKVTANMTAAGVATLFITQDYLHAADFAGCRGNVEDPAIEAGLKWMGDNFQKLYTDGNGGPQIFYGLYGVERIGVAAGRKYLGKVNWFENGADYLIAHQNPDGSFGAPNELYNADVNNVPNTAFAILFLTRGRAPIMMNKLAYDLAPATPKVKPVAGPWNQRPRDVANVTRYVGRQIERDLNWQSTTIDAPSDELDDAPIMLISGDKPLAFTPEQKDKLKRYVEEGGIILGNADCAQKLFTDSFVKLGQELFPAYKFAELPADHPIFTEQFVREKWKNKPAVRYLGNGARVLMLLAPAADMARYWQTQTVQGHEENYQLIDNLYLYAIDKQYALFRGDSYAVEPDNKIKADRSIPIARLSYEGNWDPEPAGWRRFAAVFHNRFKTDLAVQTVKLGQGELDPKKYRVAHLTGTGAVTFPEAAAAELKAFTEAGGVLLIDSTGGNSEFTTSVDALLAKAYPDSAAQLKTPLPATHPLFNATGQPTTVAYRKYARKMLGGLSAARLKTIEVNKRPAVFVSAEDLSTGLVGHHVDGIVGYEPDTATDLVADVILFTNPAPKPTTAPTTAPKK